MALTSTLPSSKTNGAAASEADGDVRKNNPIEPSKINVGDVMLIRQYVKVRSVVPGGHMVNLADLDVHMPGSSDPLTWDRQGRSIIEPMLSADQYSETVALSRTELVKHIFMRAYNVPFTVTFIKQDAKGNIGKGERRVLRGRLVEADDVFGRSFVEDLDIPSTDPGGRLRKVTHLTIEELIVGGVKYVVKK